MNNTRTLKKVINTKSKRIDKNGRDYLILELEDKEVVFVFSSKVKEERWDGLKEGQEYNLFVEEGNNGSNLLVDFEIEI